MMDSINCPFCGKSIELYKTDEQIHIPFICETCGNFIFKHYNHETEYKGWHDKIAAYLYYHKSEDMLDTPCFFIGEKDYYEKHYEKDSRVKYVSLDVIENWYPKNISEKIDRILLQLEKLSDSYGAEIKMDVENFASMSFVKRYFNGQFSPLKNFYDKQVLFICNTLKESNLVTYDIDSLNQKYDYAKFTLTATGWNRIDELQKNKVDNKKVFVSMAFNNQTRNTREAIRQGIVKAGFECTLIDEKIHNHQIVPEMFRLIRESQLLVLDISEPNYGAYYEAGYALGLGKEVIVCCKQKVFSGEKISNIKLTDEEKKKFGKYIKPHFDIVQKQILLWNNYEDLTKKLSEWIKAIT